MQDRTHARRDLRVLFVLDSLTPGGTETSTVALLPALRERGVDPAVAVFRTTPDDLRPQAHDAGTDVTVIDAPSLWRRARGLRGLIDETNPDVVHTALYVADQIGRVAAAGTGVPVVSSFVNTPYDAARTNDPNVRTWRLRAAQTVDALTGRFLVERFHAVSQGVAEANCAALRIPIGRVTVAERGRDVSRFSACTADRRRRVRDRLGLDADAPVVLNLGRLDHQKGQLVLLDAAARLIRAVPAAEVLVAGKDGSAAADLRARLRADPQLAGSVRLLGHRTDVDDLLCAADVLVVASHVEGTAGAALEAMASGTPVVATRVAGVRGILDDGRNALLVPIADAAALADALARVLSDPDLAERLADQGRQDVATRFTLAAAADRMVELYRSVLEPQR